MAPRYVESEGSLSLHGYTELSGGKGSEYVSAWVVNHLLTTNSFIH